MCNSKKTIIILLLIFALSNAAESWRGPAHFVISATGTFLLSEISTHFCNDYKLVNIYLFSSTVMIVAGFGKEFIDEANLHKNFSWEDIGVDILGITTGICFHYLLRERKKRKVIPAISVLKNRANFTVKINL